MDLGHPWSSIKNYGPHAHTAAGLDASVCKVERANPLFHCFGRAKPSIDAVAGIRVKKSGAITGITTSTVRDIVRIRRAGELILIERKVEHRIFNRATKMSYVEPGDSGSVSLAGSSIQPSNLGDGLNFQFEAIIQGMDSSIARHLRRVWTLRFTNAVVGLNTKITADRKAAYSIPIKRVLDALAVDIVYQ